MPRVPAFSKQAFYQVFSLTRITRPVIPSQAENEFFQLRDGPRFSVTTRLLCMGNLRTRYQMLLSLTRTPRFILLCVSARDHRPSCAQKPQKPRRDAETQSQDWMRNLLNCKKPQTQQILRLRPKVGRHY